MATFQTLISVRGLTILVALLLLLPTQGVGDEISDESRGKFREILALVRIPDSSLPKGVRLVEPISTAPILSVEENPDTLVEGKKLEFLGRLMGLEEAETRASVRTGFVAIYCEDDPQHEIGVYALLFNSDDNAVQILNSLVENASSRMMVRKRNLVIHVWKDPGASESALNGIKNYFESAKYPSK